MTADDFFAPPTNFSVETPEAFFFPCKHESFDAHKLPINEPSLENRSNRCHWSFRRQDVIGRLYYAMSSSDISAIHPIRLEGTQA